jgi:hypothetical protein
MMWEIFYYILAFVLGWYLYPFDNRVRHAINDIIVRIVGGIITMMQNYNQKGKTTRKKPTPKTQKQANMQSFKGKLCSTCRNTVLLPLGAEMKGFGICPQCQKMETIK